MISSFASRSLGLAALLALAAVASTAHAQEPCDGATQYAYTFDSRCAEPVWLAQRSVKDPAAYPPVSGNWALAARCTTNADCASNACDADSGQCTCQSASDCPGGAPCAADGKCSSQATFCMPQAWDSGTFWPRTGCTLDASATPATLACTTGACFATDNSGKQLLDCSAGNGGGSPNNPATQFEVTSTASGVNYDVSIAAGYNVETRAVPTGGGQVVPGTPATDVVACYPVGCTADLNATCPAALQVPGDGGTVVGCLDPCTQCQRTNPSSLQCDTPRAETWTCDGDSDPVTYGDLYCAKQLPNGPPQASPNQGTPTAFSQLDCPPVTSFVTPTFASSYALPAGQGVCLYVSPPQSTIPSFNDYRWADAVHGNRDCAALADGTACGGYRTTQSDGGYYSDAIGYTCQTATYTVDGGATQTAHLCMPPTTSGLGACTSDSAGGLPLFSASGGVTNQAWLDAAALAGGGTPYYVPFKTACQAAYAWQYDDIASGFGCTPGSAVAGGSVFSGFAVTFCGSRPAPGGGGGGGAGGGGGGNGGGGVPTKIVALGARGRAAHLDHPRRGRVRIHGRTTLATTVALDQATIVVDDVLDEAGGAGELVDAMDHPFAVAPRKRRKDLAVFETEAGVAPRVRLVLHRPRPDSEKVVVTLVVRKASIARPSACADGDTTATLETAFLVTGGGIDVRVGALAPWACKKDALRDE